MFKEDGGHWSNGADLSRKQSLVKLFSGWVFMGFCESPCFVLFFYMFFKMLISWALSTIKPKPVSLTFHKSNQNNPITWEQTLNCVLTWNLKLLYVTFSTFYSTVPRKSHLFEKVVKSASNHLTQSVGLRH